jgi:abortive infection bacteriophage resistance protein
MRNYFLKLTIQRLFISFFLFPIFIFGQNEVLIFKTLEDYKDAKGVITNTQRRYLMEYKKSLN